jgi:hypothetical protein
MSASARAVEVTIHIANLAGSNGVALSPFFVAFHDGTFDPFDAGMAANAGIEAIAELGSSDAIADSFATSHPAGISGTVGAMTGSFGPGIFLPGGMGGVPFNLDPIMHRYLTFGAMVVPSNDYFVGNDSPTAIEIFDDMGMFLGAEVMITADQIWQASTEVDDPADGPAFVDGQDALAGTAESGVISLDDDFSIFDGVLTPASYTFNNLPTGNNAIARISIVPEPAAALLTGSGALAIMCTLRRRRRRPPGASC